MCTSRYCDVLGCSNYAKHKALDEGFLSMELCDKHYEDYLEVMKEGEKTGFI